MKNLSQHITESFVKYNETPEYKAFYNSITSGDSKVPMNVIRMVLPMFKKESAEFIKNWLADYVKDAKHLKELQVLVNDYFKAK